MRFLLPIRQADPQAANLLKQLYSQTALGRHRLLMQLAETSSQSGRPSISLAGSNATRHVH